MYNFRVFDSNFLPHCGCDVEFQVLPGEALLISGENGLGKTTLAHRIFKDHADLFSIIEQASIDIFYDRKLSRIKSIMASQEAVDRELFLYLWKKLGLDQKEDRMLSRLSGGEGQALKLALGLAKKSQVILLDEPSQFLDQKSKNSLNEILHKFLDEKKAIIIIEHDMKWATFNYHGIELVKSEHMIRKGKVWNT